MPGGWFGNQTHGLDWDLETEELAISQVSDVDLVNVIKSEPKRISKKKGKKERSKGDE